MSFHIKKFGLNLGVSTPSKTQEDVEKLLLKPISNSQPAQMRNIEFGASQDLIDIYDIKSNLNLAKTKLDSIYNADPTKASKIMSAFDPFNRIKYEIAKISNAHNITNAWLKAYELICRYKLIPGKAENFRYFDNAAFPGSFILAVNHYVNTLTDIKHFEWKASSLLPSGATTSEYLGDTYNLYRNYPENWFMNDMFNGDITNTNYLHYIIRKLGQNAENHFDLYSCDLGIDVSDNYNEQEKSHFKLNLCQVIFGIFTIKKGGSMVIKHYTIFEPYTLSYISLLTGLFENFYIDKPITSKRTNSEIYLICNKFIGFNMETYNIIKLLVERMHSNDFSPLISSDYILPQIHDIRNAMDSIYTGQIKALQHFINIANNFNKPYNICYKTLLPINEDLRNKFKEHVLIPKIRSELNLNQKICYN